LYFWLFMRVSWLFISISLCGLASAQLLDDVANSALETSKIHAVRFEGLQNVDEGALRSRIPIDEGQALTPSALSSKVKAAVNSLYETGDFEDVSAWYDYSAERTDELDVVFRVQELPALDTFALDGNDAVSAEDLRPKITLVRGQVYSRSQLERDRQAILTHYRSEGYLLAEVSTVETPNAEGRNLVTFRINEGDKVVIHAIDIHGNPDVPSEDIIAGMGLEVNSWYGSGEFKEEAFEAARDSVLLVAKSKGFLDARLTEYEMEYLPDSTFKFYPGRMIIPSQTVATMLQQLNRDISSGTNPLHSLSGQGVERSSHYFRQYRQKFSDAGQALPVPTLKSEEEAAIMLNRIVTYADLRAQWIAQLPKKSWTNPLIDSLLRVKQRSDFQDKYLVRLTLEDAYPVLLTWDTIKTSSLVRIKVGIEEGRRYYAGSVHFLGNEVLASPYLRAAFQLDSGKVFDFRKYELSKQALMNMYREEGYLFARFDEQRDFQDSIVHLTFTMTEGLPAMIRRVSIAGNTRTKDKVIRREIKLFPGDLYRQSLMERSFRDVYQLNYFDNLVPDIQPVDGSDQDVDLVFHVAEREAGTGTFSAGMAYSQADGLVGTLGLQIPNCCMGDGQTANLNVEYGTDKRNFTIGFAEPWLFDKPIKLGGTVNYTWTKGSNSDNNITRYGFSSYLGKRLKFPDDYFYGQVDYSFQRYDQGSNVSNSLIRNSGIASGIGLTIIRDDKNLPIFPTEGSRFVASVAKTGSFVADDRPEWQKAMWGDFNFWKSDFTLKWWFPLVDFGSQTLSLGLTNEYGVISGNDLQYSALYQMGGALGYQGLMRGYSPGTIGYRRLGRSYQFISAELTYPIAENRFYLLPLFFDAGNVFGKRYNPSALVSKTQSSPLSDWDPSSLKRDVGFGFRVIVPMLGIIGFDFAWPLDPGETLSGYQEASVGDMQFNFLIGQGF